MNFYKAFGICIQSELIIPQFIQAQNQNPNVSIRFGDVKKLLPPDKREERLFKKSDNEIFFYWENLGWFLIKDDNEILVERYPRAEDKLLCLPLIGVVLAALLQQRNILVFHASAVSINDRGVIFVGWKGMGKSTTAAMLYGRGHAMISDDIVVVENSEKGVPWLVPGFPNFKLMPETAKGVLGDNPDNLAKIYTGAEKCYRSSEDNFLKEKVPLKSIYLLEESDELKIEKLNPQESISTLIANTYLARYGKQLLQNNQATLNLNQCAKIINQIPVYRLKRPRSFQMLDDLAELIESH